MATTATHERTRKRPWVAGVMSAIIPGSGQLYAGRPWRALVWFTPVIAVVIAAIPLASMRTSDLLGAALDPTTLWTIFGVNILAAIWRIAAAVDAFVIVSSPDDELSAVGLAVGWAVLGIAVAIPHVYVGRYTFDAATLVDAVFVVGDEVPETPIIPVGTDADIVPDPVVTTYEVDAVDPTSTRSLIFRAGLGDPDAMAVWEDIVASHRGDVSTSPFLAFNDRVGAERITILFAGGDAGPGRGGLRTDSMIIGTIDTATGKAALFGFPRNMAQIPLPRRFAGAFVDLERRLAPPPPTDEGIGEGTGEGTGDTTPDDTVTTTTAPPVFESCECFPEQLNAVYPYTRKWTRTYPDEPDPGMAALRDVLENLTGLDIDYYALIDMAAFVDLVDAIGGVDVYVLDPLESEVSPPREGEPWAYVNVEPGWNHLDGPQALAYARARKGSSDYVRMARQRCMVKAVAAKSDPFTLLRSFPAIVNAVEGSVVTDIPLTFVPDLIEATASLDFDDIETVGFTHSYWEPERDYKGHPIPDVGKIRSKVRRVVDGQSTPDAESEVSTECEV